MNEEQYTGKAEFYSKFRPTYPKELFDYLYSQIGFEKDSIIADIGAGTGKFTRLLLERGSKVFAVEPNADMLETLKNNLSEYKDFTSVYAPAEKTELLEHSVDFITVAQAFHWFDHQLFKQECRRIIKPGGKVLIVRNDVIDIDDETKRKNDDIIDFFDNIYEYKICNNDLKENRECFIGRSLSTSQAPSKDYEPKEYYIFVNELNKFFDEHKINDVLYTPLITKSYIGRV